MSGIRDYQAKNRWFKNAEYPEISAETMYKEIFPPEILEKKGDHSVRASNPIFAYKCKAIDPDGKEKTFFRNEVVFQDTFDEALELTEKNDMALCSMCSYSGKRRFAKNAFKCHGFCIDLDEVGERELQNLFGWIEELERIPRPTYIVNSGKGLHLYYLFENPVPLYPSVVEHLQDLKRGVTDWVWNKETSRDKNRQHQGIYQCFRMVGSRSKLGTKKTKDRYLLRAYRVGKPCTIAYLNKFVDDECKCPEDPDYSSWEWKDEKHLSLAECKEMFPEWYQKRVIEKQPPGQWKCNKGLYDWWLNKIQVNGNAKDGNRYYCIAMLYVYAQKCLIPKDFVTADAMNLLPEFDSLTVHENNKFTKKDIKDAGKYYDPRFVKMSAKGISKITGIPIIPSSRRNGRTREEHLKRARAVRGFSGYANVGRKRKQEMVQEWRLNHPNGRKTDCIQETGLSKPTVYKWWDKE